MGEDGYFIGNKLSRKGAQMGVLNLRTGVFSPEDSFDSLASLVSFYVRDNAPLILHYAPTKQVSVLKNVRLNNFYADVSADEYDNNFDHTHLFLSKTSVPLSDNFTPLSLDQLQELQQSYLSLTAAKKTSVFDVDALVKEDFVRLSLDDGKKELQGEKVRYGAIKTPPLYF